jgi:mannose-6-phosphate isomerase-like protein (cupin superfamily)
MKLISLDNIPSEKLSHNPNIQKKAMLSAGELGNLTNFAQAIFPPGEIVAQHSHEAMDEVFFIESGQGEILIDDVNYALHPGICVVVNARETHELRNTGDRELVITYFGIELQNS